MKFYIVIVIIIITTAAAATTSDTAITTSCNKDPLQFKDYFHECGYTYAFKCSTGVAMV
jgi:hypothetical protein